MLKQLSAVFNINAHSEHFTTYCIASFSRNQEKYRCLYIATSHQPNSPSLHTHKHIYIRTHTSREHWVAQRWLLGNKHLSSSYTWRCVLYTLKHTESEPYATTDTERHPRCCDESGDINVSHLYLHTNRLQKQHIWSQNRNRNTCI